MFKTKIINYLVNNGSKRTSEKILLKLLKIVQKSSSKNSRNIIKLSFIKFSSFINIKKNKRNKHLLIEIPFLLKSSSRVFLAVKKILGIVQQKKTNSFYFLLKYELFNSLVENNEVFKEKKEVYKKAFAKKAFAHFRWF